MTNGCFDLLHIGHLRSLEQAKSFGDILVVGVNSDASVNSLKGDRRPIVSDIQRAEMVAGLHPVDYAFIFTEFTALESLQIIHPEVYAKSADYDLAATPEGRYALANGIKLATLTYEEGCSTTEIVDRTLTLGNKCSEA